MNDQNQIQLPPIKQFQADVYSRQATFEAQLPAHLKDKAPRMMMQVVRAAIKNPRIIDCTRASVFEAITMAMELGLEPGGPLGEGYLVPYGNTCNFIPGYRGLISLARRSGQIVSIEAHVVRDGDIFEHELGLEPKLVHKPNVDAKELGAMRSVYGVAKLVGGGMQYEVMHKSEVDAIRRRSKSGNNGPWVTDYDEMARKTVIRRLFKYLPVSVEMARAMELSDEDTTLDASLEVMPDAQAIADANDRAAKAAEGRAKE